MTVVCRKCKEDTKTRVVVKHKPLKKIADLPDGYKELYCSNIIKFKKRGRDLYDWITEECRNRIIVKRKAKRS